MVETAAEAAVRSLLGIHANASRSNNVADKMGKMFPAAVAFWVFLLSIKAFLH